MASQFVQISTTGGGGGGVTSLNTKTGALTLLAGSNVSITPGAGSLTIAAVGAGFGDINNGGNTFGTPITIGTDDNFSLSLLTNGVIAGVSDTSQQWSFGTYDNANRVHGFYKDVTAGESTNSVTLNVGNSGANQGAGFLSFHNQIVTNAPSFDLGFSPRNNADLTSVQVGQIRMQKGGADDSGNMYFSTSDVGGTLNLAMSIDPSGAVVLQQELHFEDAVGGQFVGFKAPATVTATTTYILPTQPPASDQVLQSDSSSVLSWVDQVGPGGLSGSMQWNNAGAFAGVGTTDGNDVSFPNNLTLPANLANSFPYFDAAKNLLSYVGWSTTAELGQMIGVSVDEANANFIEWNVDVVPSAPTSGLNREIHEINTQLDPTNTGFQIGDNTGSGGVTILNLDGNHQASGQVGYLHIINSFSQLGDGVLTGKMANYSGFSRGAHLRAAYSLDHYIGFQDALQADVGSSLVGVSIFEATPTFNGTITNFASAMQLGPNFGATSTTAFYHAIENGGTATLGAVVTDYIGVNTFLNNVSSTSYTGYSFSPTGVTATNTVGMNLNLSGITSTNQKVGLTLNDGVFQAISNYDTATLPPSPGFLALNSLGGNLHVAAGFPITNTLIFGNNLGITAIFEDDMGPDPDGGFIGFSMNGFASEFSVALGKTVDTFNFMLAGASVPLGLLPTDGGTVSHMAMFNAVGTLNGGGSVVITNMYGFHGGVNLSTYATNAWGVHIEDPNAHNWFRKNLVIGGVSGLPTGAYALDVTGDVKTSGDIASATLTPANGATGTFTTVDLKTVTVTNGIITSIV